MGENGPIHRRITPLWNQANGQVESFMQPLTKAVRVSAMSGRPWCKDLYRFLLNYRATPHSTTGFPPATLLFNRTINTKLPQLTSQNRSKIHQQARLNDASQKQKMEENADTTRRARNTDIEEGDTVLLRQQKQNKLSTKFDKQPYIVIIIIIIIRAIFIQGNLVSTMSIVINKGPV